MISRGVGFMLLATFVFALMNVFVKLLPAIPAVEIVFFRSLISLVISVVILRSQGVSIWGKSRGWLLLRGTAGAIALVLYFITIQLIPLATAVTIQFITPIFTTIIGIFINRERVAPVQWIFFLIAFSGVLLVQGFDPRITPQLLLIGVVAAFFSGLAYNFIRKLKTSEHPLVIIFYFPLVTMPLTGAYSAFKWVQPSGWEWVFLLMVGVLTQIAQYYMTRAYQEEELNKVASVSYIGIFYALIFGWVIFGENFNLQTYLGMAVVLLGVVLNLWYKQYRMPKIN
ncbi:DMT family transporter [Fulvivirga sedimenti]|uniref:DMT family transporter n=1 Tax=Fulvivirga sedimenti TaxID=2879465 RepID=A0A9X1KYI0_9BACT|nr:DMT family transporter [Fulvivirga sedimenti]MCA6074847.1 DMT family transporter [Fulvivirga sedimenti]MCA6076024.1 DMT family transporter [Fulvivirga sedimenti]MCA6077152.1 DMT family transporter [Fulvivirga sedimenti]